MLEWFIDFTVYTYFSLEGRIVHITCFREYKFAFNRAELKKKTKICGKK